MDHTGHPSNEDEFHSGVDESREKEMKLRNHAWLAGPFWTLATCTTQFIRKGKKGLEFHESLLVRELQVFSKQTAVDVLPVSRDYWVVNLRRLHVITLAAAAVPVNFRRLSGRISFEL